MARKKNAVPAKKAAKKDNSVLMFSIFGAAMVLMLLWLILSNTGVLSHLGSKKLKFSTDGLTEYQKVSCYDAAKVYYGYSVYYNTEDGGTARVDYDKNGKLSLASYYNQEGDAVRVLSASNGELSTVTDNTYEYDEHGNMVFGNTGDTSGTGVAFTRNPATGEKKLFGEFLLNAQGEDVVAGVRTPQQIDQLANMMPEVYKQFTDICAKLEYHYRDMQDMEFTIEDGKLFMLQTRNGKRTAAAAMKIACDLVDEGMITEKEAVSMIEPKSLDALLHPTFDQAALKKAKVLGTGLAASPGAACGKVVFTAETATDWAKNGTKVVLVRLETSPEDIEGMASLLSGGMTTV